jgi:hypothetical protein
MPMERLVKSAAIMGHPKFETEYLFYFIVSGGAAGPKSDWR